MNRREVLEREEKKLSAEEIMDLLCAPEPTDDPEEIDFDDDAFDAETEDDFLRGWIQEEFAWSADAEIRQRVKEMEAERYVYS
jgi:hypothetical protein